MEKRSKNQKIPQLSVLMPVYNAGKYLIEAIESIIDQTFYDFEFLIIDDGSTDNSLSIISDYKSKDSRIIFISRENLGVTTTLNQLLGLARGKWVARMDADDISHPLRFERQIEYLEKNPKVGVLGTWVEFFGDSNKSKVWKTPHKHQDCVRRMIFSSPLAHPSVMFRGDLIKVGLIKYEETSMHAEDLSLWMQLYNCTQICNLEEVLLKYRIHSKSITRVEDSIENLSSRFECLKKLYSQHLAIYNIKHSETILKTHFVISQNNRFYFVNLQCIDLAIYLYKIFFSSMDIEAKIYALYRTLKYIIKAKL